MDFVESFVESLLRLPRWARVAFAARCARRVQRYSTGTWINLNTEHWTGIEDAIRTAEMAATHRGNPFSAIPIPSLCAIFAATAVAAAHATATAAHMEAITEGADYDGVDIDSMTAWHSTAHLAAATFSAACSASRGNLAYEARVAMLKDLETLRSVAQRDGWTDDTQVPPEFFEPLPPEEKRC
jgi:hypothetical protein